VYGKQLLYGTCQDCDERLVVSSRAERERIAQTYRKPVLQACVRQPRLNENSSEGLQRDRGLDNVERYDERTG
jgi:hypothetical protein